MSHDPFHFSRTTRCLRIVLFIVVFIITGNYVAFSKSYYFSSSTGNDSYTSIQAQDPGTPWKSIDQLNNSMSLINAGDFIYFKRGDVFTGQIILTRSGSSAARITFGAYGTGDSPVINGSLAITSWTRYLGDVWVADCPQLGSEVANFLINGKSQQIGRYPNADATNKGYLSITSHIGNTQLTSSSLTSSQDWNGGEAVVRCNRWTLSRLPIQSHQGNSLVFSKPANYEIADNFGFFIQNHINTLDHPGEWYFNPGNKKLYLYWLSDPNSIRTEASAYSSTFRANSQKYFTIENIEFKGSLKSNIHVTNSSWVTIANSKISESGEDAVFFSYCNNINFNKNTIVNTNNNAMDFIYSNAIVISSNQIIKTALRAGMGKQYTGVTIYNNISNCLFENNLIDSTGYNGIYFNGEDITIRKNIISHFCMTLDDGAGLYSGSQGDQVKLESNLVLYGLGAGEGTNNPARNGAEGIYMDINAAGVSITNNTVANCNSGIFLYNANHISISGNTLYNNNIQLRFAHSSEAPASKINNCTVTNNILFAKSSEQTVAEFRTIDNDIQNFGTFNNNFYCRPSDDNLCIITAYNSSSGPVYNNINLETWQSTFGHDLLSKKSPDGILVSTSPDDYLKFLYNQTSSDVTHHIDGLYVDVKGNGYGGFTLLPYSSVILMKSSQALITAVTDITVVGEGGATTITTEGGTLQLNAEIIPENATYHNVTWSISNNTGQATISATGLVTAITAGTVIATATATDGSGVSGSLVITISTIPVSIPETDSSQRILVYPNPVKDLLHILSNGSSFNAILIFDVSGTIVFENTNASELSFVDVSSFSKGLYVVQFKDHKSTETLKFIKN